MALAAPCMMPFLAEEAALALWADMVDTGFCIVHGVCRGALLERMLAWSDELLDAPEHQSW